MQYTASYFVNGNSHMHNLFPFRFMIFNLIGLHRDQKLLILLIIGNISVLKPEVLLICCFDQCDFPDATIIHMYYIVHSTIVRYIYIYIYIYIAVVVLIFKLQLFVSNYCIKLQKKVLRPYNSHNKQDINLFLYQLMLSGQLES